MPSASSVTVSWLPDALALTPAAALLVPLALNLTDVPYALPAGARVVESEPASGAGQVAPHGWVVFNP